MWKPAGRLAGPAVSPRVTSTTQSSGLWPAMWTAAAGRHPATGGAFGAAPGGTRLLWLTGTQATVTPLTTLTPLIRTYTTAFVHPLAQPYLALPAPAPTLLLAPPGHDDESGEPEGELPALVPTVDEDEKEKETRNPGRRGRRKTGRGRAEKHPDADHSDLEKKIDDLNATVQRMSAQLLAGKTAENYRTSGSSRWKSFRDRLLRALGYAVAMVILVESLDHLRAFLAELEEQGLISPETRSAVEAKVQGYLAKAKADVHLAELLFEDVLRLIRPDLAKAEAKSEAEAEKQKLQDAAGPVEHL